MAAFYFAFIVFAIPLFAVHGPALTRGTHVEIFRVDHILQLPLHTVSRGPDLPVMHTEVVAARNGVMGGIEPNTVVEYVHMGVTNVPEGNDRVLPASDGFLFHKVTSNEKLK